MNNIEQPLTKEDIVVFIHESHEIGVDELQAIQK